MQSLAAIRRTLLLVPCAWFVILSTLFAATITMGETSVFAGDDSGNASLLLAQDRTLSPRGGSLDDTAPIQSALETCPRGQVVKLSPGTFNINAGGLHFRRSD